ncbi:MAG: hypothetical protein COW88_02065 [Candidatus Lloydbacteria bacterium CG22_combo_CG10-13_8_21_14_all_47_15]|uniref:General secretion pathway GspH domain-containing protein n=1 Tax=Candidatus Lloydbacteria bacterium CG22_combo_CG10-13_8_21_14_all_47_15 TaxID=1974635 RepID=A0A2H0CTX5_9BACT|nr:MAG: hypothetical protein COW88_02065 [Candidatus Lloydbacteria bacterium CG22_combo_CG10-13_8_21_14_all_47_15]
MRVYGRQKTGIGADARRNTGFTLVEILVSLVILMMLAVIVASPLARWRNTQVLVGEVGAMISLIEDARSRTLGSLDGKGYGVHFDTDNAVLFAGTSFTPGAPDNELHMLHSSARIDAISLFGGGSDLVFKRLSGETGQYGSVTIVLTGDTAQTRRIDISKTGAISIAK